MGLWFSSIRPTVYDSLIPGCHCWKIQPSNLWCIGQNTNSLAATKKRSKIGNVWNTFSHHFFNFFKSQQVSIAGFGKIFYQKISFWPSEIPIMIKSKVAVEHWRFSRRIGHSLSYKIVATSPNCSSRNRFVLWRTTTCRLLLLAVGRVSGTE